MKIYVINLKERTDRLFHMQQILTNLIGEGRYEIFEAINGRALADKDVKTMYRPIRALIAKGARMTRGELGCALSHLGVYRKMLASHIDIALVLEDDLKIKDGFMKVVDYVSSTISHEIPEVYILSVCGTPPRYGCNPQRELISDACCADAYIINATAAKMILQDNFPVKVVSDVWGRWRADLGIKLYRCYPTVALQGELFSSNVSTARNTRIFRWALRIIDKLLRCVRL